MFISKMNLKPVELSIYVNYHTSIHFSLCALVLTICSYPQDISLLFMPTMEEKKSSNLSSLTFEHVNYSV